MMNVNLLFYSKTIVQILSKNLFNRGNFKFLFFLPEKRVRILLEDCGEEDKSEGEDEDE